MATKAILFILAYSVLFATTVSSIGDGRDLFEVFPPKKAPAPCPPPVKPPVHSPPPAKAPVHPPPPAQAPVYPPPHGEPCLKDRHHYSGCATNCTRFAEINGGHMKTNYQRICTACCTKTKCVPDFGKTPCDGWTEACYEDKVTPCPQPLHKN